MKNFILLEFFTSQSIYGTEINQYILKEALNITNSIIKNFSRNSEINKLYVVRNQELETFETQKVKFLSTNKKKSFIDILKNFNTDTEIIVIAPETNKVNINLQFPFFPLTPSYSSSYITWKINCAQTKMRNTGTALLLAAFVGGVYYRAISSMQQTVRALFVQSNFS